jgi:hypothetical protein
VRGILQLIRDGLIEVALTAFIAFVLGLVVLAVCLALDRLL